MHWVAFGGVWLGDPIMPGSCSLSHPWPSWEVPLGSVAKQDTEPLVPGWLASSRTSGTAGLESTTGLKSADGHPSIHAELRERLGHSGALLGCRQAIWGSR